MFKARLTLPLAAFFASGLALAGQVGQQEPGQKDPGQKPGQEEPGQQPGQLPGQQPGQQDPGQVHQCAQHGVQLAVMVQGNVRYVYVYKLMNEFGTLARLGLHNGDVIWSLANQKQTTPQQVEQTMGYLEMQRHQAGKPILVPVTIARGGQWYTWQATLN